LRHCEWTRVHFRDLAEMMPIFRVAGNVVFVDTPFPLLGGSDIRRGLLSSFAEDTLECLRIITDDGVIIGIFTSGSSSHGMIITWDGQREHHIGATELLFQRKRMLASPLELTELRTVFSLSNRHASLRLVAMLGMRPNEDVDCIARGGTGSDRKEGIAGARLCRLRQILAGRHAGRPFQGATGGRFSAGLNDMRGSVPRQL
jgi:hypothetical protein